MKYLHLTKVLFTLILFSFFFIFSCTRLGTLGTKAHRFSDIPTNVVWIQIEGFQEDHLGMLYFSRNSTLDTTGLMNSPCLGKMWNFNLFEMRSDSFTSLMAQTSGTKNLKGTCEDFENPPIWRTIQDERIRKGVLEIEANGENSLLKVKTCPSTNSTKNYLKDVALWKMSSPPLKKDGNPLLVDYFHAEKSSDGAFKEGNVYYDRSCKTGSCFNSISKNVQYILDEFFPKTISGSLFIIRDFSYGNALKSGKINKARAILEDIEKVVSYFSSRAENEPHFLFLVSTVESRGFPYPEKANVWYNFDKNPLFELKTYPSNMNAVFAIGAKAENFCGIYEEYELLSRLFKQENNGRLGNLRY